MEKKNLNSIFQKQLVNPKKIDQIVIIILILTILINMTVKIMEVIYHHIRFYIVFLSFG